MNGSGGGPTIIAGIPAYLVATDRDTATVYYYDDAPPEHIIGTYTPSTGRFVPVDGVEERLSGAVDRYRESIVSRKRGATAKPPVKVVRSTGAH